MYTTLTFLFSKQILRRCARNYATEHEIPIKSYGEDKMFPTQFMLYNLKEGPSTTVKLTHEQLIAMYKELLGVRKVETTAAKMYLSKEIRGFCHLYSGQEAVLAGIMSAKRQQDTLISSYRSHGWTYSFSKSVPKVIGELMGNEIGCSKGKGGSMHMYATNFFGGNGIVGAQVPLGVGIGLMHQYKKTDGVSFTCYGDGAANQGQTFEAFNIAALHKFPVVFVCENNKYGMGTAAHRSSASTDYYTRGQYFPGIRTNGMDAFAVYSGAKFCIDYALKNGPILLEAVTYRYFGHSMSDPGTSYRSRDEISTIRNTSDPIKVFKSYMEDTKFMSSEELKTIDAEMEKIVKDGVQTSRASKCLSVDHLAREIHKNNLTASATGTLPWKQYSCA